MKNLTILLSVITLFSFFSCEKEALVLPEQAQEETNYEIPAAKLETETTIYSKGETPTVNSITLAGNQEVAPIEPTTTSPQVIPVFNAPSTPETPPRTTTGISIYTPDTHQGEVIIFGEGDDNP